MMIFGGYNGNEDCHFNDLFSFDPVTSVWSQFYPRGTPPCARRRQSCCLNGDRVFLFGGTRLIMLFQLKLMLPASFLNAELKLKNNWINFL